MEGRLVDTIIYICNREKYDFILYMYSQVKSYFRRVRISKAIAYVFMDLIKKKNSKTLLNNFMVCECIYQLCYFSLNFYYQ